MIPQILVIAGAGLFAFLVLDANRRRPSGYVFLSGTQEPQTIQWSDMADNPWLKPPAPAGERRAYIEDVREGAGVGGVLPPGSIVVAKGIDEYGWYVAYRMPIEGERHCPNCSC